MTVYLIHQNRAGDPLGVFSETDYYYPPGTPQQVEDYGVSATERGYDQSWPEMVEQQASRTPSPTANWDAYDHPDAPLDEVFADVRRDTTYN